MNNRNLYPIIGGNTANGPALLTQDPRAAVQADPLGWVAKAVEGVSIALSAGRQLIRMSYGWAVELADGQRVPVSEHQAVKMVLGLSGASV